MTRARAWTLLPSRRRFDPLAPDPWTWTDEDLATGLSRTNRWAGRYARPTRGRSAANSDGSLALAAVAAAPRRLAVPEQAARTRHGR